MGLTEGKHLKEAKGVKKQNKNTNVPERVMADDVLLCVLQCKLIRVELKMP